VRCRKLLRGIEADARASPGSNLDVDMTGAPTVGIWGWTEKPGTLAHWPGASW
jgi:2,5-dihydroxypyridine 5,6-dioxygenase